MLIEDWAWSDGWFSSDISWERSWSILSDIDTISSDNIQDWGIKCEAWTCNQHRNDFLICSVGLIPTEHRAKTPPGRNLTALPAPEKIYCIMPGAMSDYPLSRTFVLGRSVVWQKISISITHNNWHCQCERGRYSPLKTAGARLATTHLQCEVSFRAFKDQRAERR